MNFKATLACSYRIGTIATITGLVILTCGCSMPEQMSTPAPSSSASTPASSDSESPGGQATGAPATLDSSNSGAGSTDIPVENGENFDDDGPKTPGGSADTFGENPDYEVSADIQLEKALEEFDDLFKGEITNSNVDILDPMGADTATSGSNDPLFEELDGNTSFEEVADSAPSSAAPSGEPRDQEVGGNAGNVGASQPLPDDIGDGRGDNVIERQIRQAALQESDPALREQLWDEYRRMKGQKD